MKKQNKSESFISRFHLLPKFVCLLLGFVIWIYVMEVESPDYEEVFKDVSITVVGETDLKTKNLSILTNYKVPVDVTVRGRKSEISKYSSEDITIRIDVSGVTESKTHEFKLDFEMPQGISYVDASMKSISLFIDKSASETIELKSSIKNYKLATQYVLGEVRMDTEFVTVEGPVSLIDQIDYAAVEIDMGDNFLTQTLTTDGDIVLHTKNGERFENKDLKMLKISDSIVHVTVPIYSQKEVPLVAEGKYGYYNSSNTEISITPAKIKIMGEPYVIESIDSINVADIDEKKTTEAEVEFESDIELPDGVFFVSGQSTVANIKLKHIGLSVKKFNVRNIEIINPNNLDIQLLDESVTVEVRGDSAAVRMLDAEDITLVVDLSLNKENQGEIHPVADVKFNVSDALIFELGSYEVRILVK